MIYQVLKILIRITLRVFFKKRVLEGLENIPNDGPLILLANHPGTFMDPLIIASITKRKVYFLAKGAMFKGKLVNWVFKRFNMIPVYRQQDSSGDMHKNQETFSKCYEHLEKNGVILMFPEGVSITEKKLKPIKTGAARIALGAESQNEFNLGVKIVTIGLNYENPHQFRKNVLVKVGEAFTVEKYKQKYNETPRIAVTELTDEIKTLMLGQVIDIKEKRQEVVVDMIQSIYKDRIMKNPDNVSDVFETTKTIASAVKFYADYQPSRFYDFYWKVISFRKTLKQLRLEKTPDLIELKEQKSIWMKSIGFMLKMVLKLPFALFGLIHNYLPFALAPILTRKINNELEYRGPISMVLGMFMYLFLYVGLGWLMWHFTHNWFWTILYVSSLPITGMLAYNLSLQYQDLKYRWHFLSLFYKRSVLISELVLTQKKMLKEIISAHKEYEDQLI